MGWRLGAMVCLLRDHRPVLWSNAPEGPVVVCLRCHVVMQHLL